MSDQPRHDHAHEQLTAPPSDDAVIEEVRAIRRRLWEESGRDVRRYIQRVREAERRPSADRPPEPKA